MSTDPLMVTLARIRFQRHMSQVALAESAGVQHSSLNRWECGRAEPRLSSLRALLDALGLDLEVVPMASTALPVPAPVERAAPATLPSPKGGG